MGPEEECILFATRTLCKCYNRASIPHHVSTDTVRQLCSCRCGAVVNLCRQAGAGAWRRYLTAVLYVRFGVLFLVTCCRAAAGRRIDGRRRRCSSGRRQVAGSRRLSRAQRPSRVPAECRDGHQTTLGPAPASSGSQADTDGAPTGIYSFVSIPSANVQIKSAGEPMALSATNTAQRVCLLIKVCKPTRPFGLCKSMFVTSTLAIVVCASTFHLTATASRSRF